MLGAIVMIVNQRFRLKNFEIPGFLLMSFPIFYFDDNWIADFEPKIICLVGTSILLLNNNKTHIFHSKTYLKLFSKLGLASYSLYLIHQPFYAYLKIWNPDLAYSENIFLKIILIILQILFAIYIYEKIEKYFMEKRSYKELFILPILITTILFYCFFAINSSGFENRYIGSPLYEKAINYSNVEKYDLKINNEVCHKTSKSSNVNEVCRSNVISLNDEIVVLGDSLSRLVIPELFKEVQNNSISFITGDSCIFLIDRVPKNCVRSDKDTIYNEINNLENKIIIYFADVRDKLEDPTLELEQSVKLTIQHLLKKNIVIAILPYPEFMELNVIEQVLKGREEVKFPLEQWKNRNDVVKSYKIFNDINHPRYFKIVPEKIFCDTFIKNQCVGATKQNIYVQDSIHLTIEGGSLLASEILKSIDQIND